MVGPAGRGCLQALGGWTRWGVALLAAPGGVGVAGVGSLAASMVGAARLSGVEDSCLDILPGEPKLVVG